MKKNRFIIIGLGGIGQELLKRLSKDFEITCIDLKKESEEIVQRIRPDCRVITGDATSRLILDDAGVNDADGIIITTTDERVNIEVARVPKEHFNPRRVIAVASTQKGIETLESTGVEVENIFTASATVIRNRLEQTTRTAHAIGLGKDEIMEVEIHPYSRLANRPLRTLTPIRWRIGIIYRDENIIIPNRETILKPKDRVIILGEPAVLKTVSEILTFKFQRFPLEYGSTMVSYLTGKEGDGFFEEVDYLFSIFPLKKVIFILSKKATKKEYTEERLRQDHINDIELKSTILSPVDAISMVVDEVKSDIGLIVISKKGLLAPLFPMFLHMIKRRFLDSLLNTADCPVLLSNETHPYKKTIVPCVEGVNLQHSLETSFEISRSLNNEITAFLTRPSKYISSDEDVDGFEGMKKTINDMVIMHRSSINTIIEDGNPVRIISGSLKNYNLLIASVSGWKQRQWLSILSPDIPWHIIKDSSISTLLLPYVEEAL
jgi:hypothetical protein